MPHRHRPMDSKPPPADDFFTALDWFARNSAETHYRPRTKVRSPASTAPNYANTSTPSDRNHSIAIPTVFDNSWSGLDVTALLLRKLRKRENSETSQSGLPKKHDWKDPVSRKWIEWNYARRVRTLGSEQQDTNSLRWPAVAFGRHEQRNSVLAKHFVP